MNIIENEKRRISKIGKEVEELIEKEKNSALDERIINKLRDITNLKNCDYAPIEKLSDSENNPMEDTINDINLPEPNKDVFMSFANQSNKEIEDLFNRASILNVEEEKAFNNENKDQFSLENNQNVPEIEREKIEGKREEKKEEIGEKNDKQQGEKIEENLEVKKTNILQEKEENNEEEKKNNEVVKAVPLNISKSLGDILDHLNQTCQIKYVYFFINYSFISQNQIRN